MKPFKCINLENGTHVEDFFVKGDFSEIILFYDSEYPIRIKKCEEPYNRAYLKIEYDLESEYYLYEKYIIFYDKNAE